MRRGRPSALVEVNLPPLPPFPETVHRYMSAIPIFCSHGVFALDEYRVLCAELLAADAGPIVVGSLQRLVSALEVRRGVWGIKKGLPGNRGTGVLHDDNSSALGVPRSVS